MGSGEGAAPAQADGRDLAVMNDIVNFDTDAFEGGPSFRKAVCLPRRLGCPMHGAHSHALTRARFRIRHAEAPEIGSRLATDDAQASCGKFEEFAGERDDPALSEIGASRRCPPTQSRTGCGSP